MIDQISIRPSGHKVRIGLQQKEVHSSDLERKALEWLEMDFGRYAEPGHAYNIALEITNKLKTSTVEIYTLLPQFLRHPNYPLFGIFISAVYNERTQEPAFLYTHDVPLDHIGFRCHKILINSGTLGDKAFREGTGVFLNLGTLGKDAAASCDGVVCNFGNAGTGFASNGKGLIINDGLVNNGIARSNFAYRSSGRIALLAPAGDVNSYSAAHALYGKPKIRRRFREHIAKLKQSAMADDPIMFVAKFGAAKHIRKKCDAYWSDP
jgi:hypothetical protein